MSNFSFSNDSTELLSFQNPSRRNLGVAAGASALLGWGGSELGGMLGGEGYDLIVD